ncbi:hypothetical protein GDO81_026503 [Engystomops pustulosus]|uniref:Uncharacterized protein n=1 Tax=Engystomops pustulosus TaxID=76066 RepID=A0AAV6YMD8_ENGPU|nr:hypothetical protein GDO81_026503 [Engystomops pustulosus]
MNGPYKKYGGKLFQIRSNQKTRGHCLRLEKSRFNHRRRQGFFTMRTVNLWNSLPQALVTAGTAESFKKGLDAFLHLNNIDGYVI